MGSPENEPERKATEGPQRAINIAAFAIGETEVTRGQYAIFVNETRRAPPAHGCFTFGFSSIEDGEVMDPKASWRNPGFKQADDHPVTCVSWQDAHDYTVWLARKTGKPYRLPAEAEWEYVARAGSTSIFPWGTDEDHACPHANVAGENLLRALPKLREQVNASLRAGERNLRVVQCDDGDPFTSTVRKHQPNPFGLYDTIGNVWEYVADCWQEPLPENGRAYEPTSCESRRVRGGSWDDAPPELRSARRSRVKPDLQRNDGGFRIARDLAAR
jgi:formylglycine-generating enzyme required for sulfatase activity